MVKMSLLLAMLCLLCAAPSCAYDYFIYVSNYGDGTISQFRANQNGTLTPLSPSAVRAHGLAHGLAADPSGHFLYVISARDWTRRDCVVSQFQIAPDGRLSPLSPTQVAVPGTPASIAVEPSGKFVYVFNREGTVAQFRIGNGGRLSPLPRPVIKAANAGGVTPIIGFDEPHHILYGSYIVGFGEMVIGAVFTLAIEQNGQLRALPGRQAFHTSEEAVSPPYSISLTPDGHYAYVPESVQDKRRTSPYQNVVAQYRMGTGSILIPLSPKTIAVRTVGTNFMDPKRRFLYMVGVQTFEREAAAQYRLACARIHGNGTLGLFRYQPLPIQASLPAKQAFSLAFDRTGQFCYFADGNSVYLFRIHADGSLSSLHPPKVVAGYGPSGILCVRR